MTKEEILRILQEHKPYIQKTYEVEKKTKG